MIKYIKGDLFQAPQTIIAHGCNCQGGFGSGVAGIMLRKYPEARNKYIQKHHAQGWKLGDIQIISTGNKIIVNCATQDRYGNGQKDGNVYCDYPAIKQVMIQLKALAIEKKAEIAIPKIGAGLANGDWNIIESIINEVFHDQDIFVYYLD